MSPKAGRRVACSPLSSNLSRLGPSTRSLCLSAGGQAVCGRSPEFQAS